MATSPNELIRGNELGVLNDIEQVEFGQLKELLNKGNELGVLNEQEAFNFNRIQGNPVEVSTLKRKAGRFLEEERKVLFPTEQPIDVKKLLESEFPIGATLGGITGGLVGLSRGVTPAAILSGAGAAAGEFSEQRVRSLLGFSTPDSFLDGLSEVGKEGLLGVGAELGARVVLGGGEKLLRLLTNRIPPSRTQAIRFLEDRLGQKVGLTPGEATEFRPFDILENITDASAIGGNRFFDFKRNRVLALERFASAFGDDIGSKLSSDQVGQLVLDVINRRVAPRKAGASVLFNTVGDATRNIKNLVPVAKRVNTGLVDTRGRPIIREVTEQIEQDIVDMRPVKEFMRRLTKDQKDIKLGRNLSGNDLRDAILSEKDFMSVPQAQAFRSLVLKAVDETRVISPNAPAIRLARNAQASILSQIRKSLQKFAPNQLDNFDEARRLTFEANKPFNDKFIQRLIRSSDVKFGGKPGILVNKIFTRDNTAQIKNLKQFIDKDTFTQMKGFFTRDVFAKSVDPKTGNLVGSKLNSNLFGRTGVGETSLKEIFNPKELSSLRQLTNALEVTQAAQSEGLGKVFIQLKQAGAIVQVGAAAFTAQQGNIGESAAILIAPALIARAFTNPTFVKTLLSARIPNKQKVLTNILAKIATEISFSDMTLLDIGEFLGGERLPQLSAPLQRPEPAR